MGHFSVRNLGRAIFSVLGQFPKTCFLQDDFSEYQTVGQVLRHLYLSKSSYFERYGIIIYSAYLIMQEYLFTNLGINTAANAWLKDNSGINLGEFCKNSV